MKLWVNGVEQEVAEGLSVRGLLESLGLQDGRVAVEVNTQVIRKALHAQHLLQRGDRVEVVTFVGGG